MTTGNDPEDEAARWIARRQSGEMTDKMQREYAAWLAHEENRNAIADHERLLAAFDAAEDLDLAAEFEAQLHEAYENRAAQSPAVRRPAARGYAIAASIAFALALGVSTYLAAPSFRKPVVYASHVGEQLSVTLRDGSTATLNTNSAVEVRFSATKRKVEVTKGEALFDVARDADRPFVVAMPLGEVQVTGTVFNVRALPDETSVFVISGLVQVTPEAGDAVRLGAGEKVRIDPRGRAEVATFNPERALAWREGKARYADAPLGDVLDDLNRYFAKPIRLGDASLASLPVTGEFDVSDQDTAVAAIAAAFGLALQKGDSKIVLSPAAAQ